MWGPRKRGTQPRERGPSRCHFGLQNMLRYLAVVLNLLVLWVNAVPKNPLNGAVDDIVDAWRAGTPPPELWRQLHGLNAVFMDHVKEDGFDWASGAAEKELRELGVPESQHGAVGEVLRWKGAVRFACGMIVDDPAITCHAILVLCRCVMSVCDGGVTSRWSAALC